jgi:murein DD-endopeptidase MepM/ murein hydrolase activator NlpD
MRAKPDNNYDCLRDFKDLGNPPNRSKSHRVLRYALGAAIVIAVSWMASGTVASIPPTPPAPLPLTEANRDEPVQGAEAPTALAPIQALGEETDPAAPVEPGAQSQASADPLPTGPEPDWREVTVRRGDTLSGIFSRLQLKPNEAYLVSREEDARVLNRLAPGQKLKIAADDDGVLQRLIYDIDPETVLQVSRIGTTDPAASSFQVSQHTRELQPVVRTASGTIDSSLFLAAQQAGLSDNMTMQLAAIFGWDIDFVLDIRSGDQFRVIYEEQFLEGRKVRDGDILAAEFINQGHTFRAVRYTTPDGNSSYYTPEGANMRKAFLRAPVNFTRISSRFSLGRKHPILNRIRAHKGVDYAAPTGTPVRATGDGKVIFRGWKGGYGKVVMLQHGSKYTTVYGHMSRFARTAKSGSRVKQGQVIGYVGMTGLATGPHLHYEFRVHGVHRNPLTVALPSAEAIAPAYRDDFKRAASVWVAKLDQIGTPSLASADTGKTKVQVARGE